MIIMKFGGSSVKDAERIKSVTEIIKENLDKSPVIVFSAMGKVTDMLLACGEKALKDSCVDIAEIREIHEKITKDLGVEARDVPLLLNKLEELLTGISLIRELSSRTRDFLVSFGERLSVRIISSYLNKIGINSIYHDAWDIGFVTDSEFQNASLLRESYKNIKKNMEGLKEAYSYTPVVTGFIAKDASGNITTLGRGGSDLTASILGNALDAVEVQVWKDVDGLMSTDPKIIGEAEVVSEISFEEASELAYFGAKILHPQSMLPAMEKNIPVRVKNSYKKEMEGTLIKKTVHKKDLIKVISFQRRITVIDIVSTRMLGLHGFLAKVFDVFARYKISVDMIASSEVSISLTLNKNSADDDNIPVLIEQLKEIANVAISKSKAMVTIVGDVSRSSEIMAGVFNELLESGVNVQMISQGASKHNISFIIDESELEMTVKSIHRKFFRQK